MPHIYIYKRCSGKAKNFTKFYSIMAVVEEKGLASGREDYTQDGTVDLKGRPVLRSNTGRWRACSFIVGKNAMQPLGP